MLTMAVQTQWLPLSVDRYGTTTTQLLKCLRGKSKSLSNLVIAVGEGESAGAA